jgi:hypothetical protein
LAEFAGFSASTAASNFPVATAVVLRVVANIELL